MTLSLLFSFTYFLPAFTQHILTPIIIWILLINILRAYVSKPFLENLYRELKKLSNFLIVFSIPDKNYLKTDC